MANARMISREFFTSADLEGIGARGKLLFAGMIVFADDAGIIRHHLGFYRATLLQGSRISPASVMHVLSTLEARNVLESCILEGVKCWRITNFAKFQRLKRREGKRREDEVEANAALMQVKVPPKEPKVNQAGDLYWRLQQHPLNFGHLKALAVLEKLREPKDATLAAWLAYEGTGGTVGLVSKIQRFSHPDEIPAPVLPKTTQQLKVERMQARIMKESNVLDEGSAFDADGEAR